MTLQTVSPGQPLDVGFINTIISEVNAIGTNVNAQNLATLSNVSGTNKKTSALMIAAGKTPDLSLTKGTKDSLISSTWGFSSVVFNTTPIVVGTIINTAQDAINKELILNITSVTTSTVSFEILAANGALTGNFTIAVNFIAIGI